MNQIHGRFEISNDDFLYVLSSFVFEPIRWNARFGWRPLIETERLASFHFWLEVGRLMAISELPERYEEFERFNEEYEERHFARSRFRTGRGSDARHVPGVVPPAPRRFGAHAIYALMDDRLLAAFGFPQPPSAARRGRGCAASPSPRGQRLCPHAAARACAPDGGP